MLSRWTLCFVVPFLLAACDDASTNTSGTTGDSSECTTGGHAMSFGANGNAATNGIVSDDSGLYWADDDGTVWHAGPVGDSPALFANNVGTTPYTIATDADAIYVVDYATAIYRIEKTTAAVKMLAQGSFSGVAVDDKNVYATQTDGVYRLDKQNGMPTLVADIPSADSVVVDDTDIYVRTVGSAGDMTARLVRVSKMGGMPTDVSPAEPLAYHYFSQELAVDATHVYWINSSAGSLSRIAKAGGTAENLASGLADPMGMTTDDGFVYVTIRGKDGGSLEDRAVVKIPKAGGAQSFIAHGAQVSAFAIAVDATNAYWTQHATGGAVETACK